MEQENITTNISVIMPTIMMLVLAIATIINFSRNKKWYNLLQIIGAFLIMIPHLVLLTKLYLLHPAGLYIGEFAIIVFVSGYMAMAIKNKE